MNHMRVTVTTLIAVLLTYYAVQTTWAAEYYISQSGIDSNPGTRVLPWRTIDKANAVMVAGDIVLVGPGTYSGTISPANSGAAGKPIVYRNLSDQKPLVRVSGEDLGVQIKSKSHIVVDGFRIVRDRPPSGQSFNIEVLGSNNVTIKNCELVGTPTKESLVNQFRAGLRESGIAIYGGADNLLEGNRIERYAFQGIKLTGQTVRNTIRRNDIRDNLGDAVRIDSAKSVIQGQLIEQNRMSGSLASDGVQTNGDFDSADPLRDTSTRGIIVRNNTIFGNGENGIDIKGSRFFVIEGNTIFGNISDNEGFVDAEHSRGTPGGIGKGNGFGSVDIIIRNNVIYDNNTGILATHGWKIYNNTIVGNNHDYTGSNSSYAPSQQAWLVGIRDNGWSMDGYSRNVGIKNNIMANHNAAQIRLDIRSQVDIDHNLYFDASSKTEMALHGPNGWTAYLLGDWRKALQGNSRNSGFDLNSQVADPLFAAAPQYPVGKISRLDFRLKPSSPAIDAGGALTRTIGSGAGTQIAVADSGYFFDGYGIVEGDLIQVGNSNPTRIIRVDYSKNLLFVSRSISWSANDGVSLPFLGSRPDVGALEYGSESNQDNPLPPRLF